MERRERKKGLGLSPQKPQVIPAATQTRVPTASHCAESRCSSHGLPQCFRLWASVKPRLRAACRRYRGFRRASLLRARARASNSVVTSTKPHLRLDDNGARLPPVTVRPIRAVFKADRWRSGGAARNWQSRVRSLAHGGGVLVAGTRVFGGRCFDVWGRCVPPVLFVEQNLGTI